MTAKPKTAAARLRITQVHSIIGNQERVKRVVTDGLGLRRIGRSVVLPDNPYTRGMIAKAAHIVTFEELAAAPHLPAPEPHAEKPEETRIAVPDEVEKLVEAAVGPVEKPTRKKTAAAPAAEPKPKPKAKAPATKAPAAKAPAKAPRKRTGTKDKE
jgi:large subunit ribosomal protein L30